MNPHFLEWRSLPCISEDKNYQLPTIRATKAKNKIAYFIGLKLTTKQPQHPSGAVTPTPNTRLHLRHQIRSFVVGIRQ